MVRFFVGLFVSCVYQIWIFPKNVGEEPAVKPTVYSLLHKGMIIIPLCSNAIHLHHWVVYFILCLLGLISIIPNILIGFSLGLFVQDIRYKDSLNFICSNPYNKQLHYEWMLKQSYKLTLLPQVMLIVVIINIQKLITIVKYFLLEK